MAETRADDVVVTGVGVCCNLGDDLAAIEEHLREGRGGRFARWAPAVEMQTRCQILGRYEGDVSDAAVKRDVELVMADTKAFFAKDLA